MCLTTPYPLPDPHGSAWCGITGLISTHPEVETTSCQLWGVLYQEPWNDSLSLGGENPIRERHGQVSTPARADGLALSGQGAPG